MKDIRDDFPQLKRKINGKRLVYLDSSATSLKPRQVISKEQEYYTKYCANVFRGIYRTSEEATAAFEEARRTQNEPIQTTALADLDRFMSARAESQKDLAS